jgi:hypothetical protein
MTDSAHQRALALAFERADSPIVTTDEVLVRIYLPDQTCYSEKANGPTESARNVLVATRNAAQCSTTDRLT